jgi:hypothetical protein
MRFPRTNLVLLLFFLISSCSVRGNDIPLADEIASPTPFQPSMDTASDSPYAGAAPTPFYLPSVTPLPPAEVVAGSLPVDSFIPTVVVLPILNPLTGLSPTDPAFLERRPLAIKVANYPRYIRPQSGLTSADHVYEYYIEGGLTRFIAVFYGNNSEWVGPVRSGRYFDENIQRMYQAFLVFKFADPRVLDHFKFSDFSDFIVVPSNGSCPPFKLMPTRHIEVYNNSYFYTPEWDDCVAKNNLNNDRPSTIRGSYFNEAIPLSELDANQIYTYYSEYSYHYWSYIPETQQYVRFQETNDIHNGKPEKYEQLVDQVTSTPVHASNVVVLLASHTFANTFDQEDEVFQIDLTGTGEAYVFRDGVGFVAQWRRTNENQPVTLTTANGSAIHLRPGITFYEVIGARSYVDQDAGEWHFHHDTP